MEHKYKLYGYQEEGRDFILDKVRCILGDDMGLGKTMQSIAVADEIEAKKILVVVPKALMYSWEHEIKKFAHRTDVAIVDGTPTQRKAAIAANKTWTIVTYALLRDIHQYVTKKKNKDGAVEKSIKVPKYPEIAKTKWDLVICDEFHNVSGRSSQQTKGCRKLKSTYFVGLTGTPILTKPEQMFQQLQIIDKEKFSSFGRWVDEFMKTAYNPFSRFTPKIVGIRDYEQFKDMLHPYFLRRTKEEVLDLPEVIFKPIPIMMDKKTRKIYNDLETEMLTILEAEDGQEEEAYAIGTVLEKQLRLRQLCLDPSLILETSKLKAMKTEALLEIISNLENEEQVVIFTSFKGYANKLYEALKKAKYNTCLFTGDTKDAERKRIITEFAKKKIRIFVGTLKAGGVGLNLQTASHMIFTDKDWSPAINRQAIARTHRMGQKNVPVVMSLYYKDSIEEHVERVLQERGDMIDAAIVPTELYRLSRK